MKQPYPKVGQVWKIPNLADSKFQYVLVTQVFKQAPLPDTLYYEIIGDNETNRKPGCYVTWLMVNAELVSG
jgi:hypothetical protein